MYNSMISAKVTRALTCFFFALLFLLMAFANPILKWFFGPSRIETIKIILITFYICCPAAWCALICIFRLLTNIINGKVFVQKNVSSMRVLSWCCAFVTAACLISGVFYVPFLIFSLGAAFMMLILRVLKNVMSAATEIKDENELTI